MRRHTQPDGRCRGTTGSPGIRRPAHARAYAAPRYRHIRPVGRLLPAYGVCPGIRAIDNPRPARQTRFHPLRPARTRDASPLSRRASTHAIRFRIHSALSTRRRLPGHHTKVSISPVRAAMLRDCSKKVSTTRANGNLDEILRFLDVSSMMVSREKAWNFNDS